VRSGNTLDARSVSKRARRGPNPVYYPLELVRAPPIDDAQVPFNALATDAASLADDSRAVIAELVLAKDTNR
jgi:hypothetical protein